VISGTDELGSPQGLRHRFLFIPSHRRWFSRFGCPNHFWVWA